MVWFVVGIVEILIEHFTTRYFYMGLCNKARIVVTVVIMGCLVAYCGVSA
ncbi:hypothetical protein LCGC14_2788770 [marine sediment metagenome]|uniref:Uncharacterized protein n=1 Tax=marine sediment metagenome TaxID=412755 RepID=A0A0F8YR50_9ZZZZ